MKIVFIAPFGIRPKGTVIARMLPLAAELQLLGCTVTVVAPPYTNPEDSGRVEVIRGVRLVNVVLPQCGRMLSTLVLTMRILSAVWDEQPDLVHLFKPKGYGGLAAILYLSLQRLGLRLVPLFLDTDDWEGKGGMNDLHSYSMLEKRLFAFQEQWLSMHAAGVTVASRELENLTGEIGVAPERICYLPNCVEETSSGDGRRIREKLGISNDTPVVLLYTRFFEFNQERLYQVFAGIRQRVTNVCFLVVGKGRNHEEDLLMEASIKRGFDGAMIMAGWLEPEDIPDYLAAGDVAIYPMDETLINRAKCPAKLTELLVAGVPVVADRVGQALEYIVDGISGVLCNPEKPECMIDETVGLLLEPARRHRVSVEGRRHLIDHFNWCRAALILDKFYRRIMNI